MPATVLLITSSLRSHTGYSHANLKESALQVSKQHQPSIKIQPNAQHATTTRIRCYCYVQTAGTAALLQPRCYWADCRPEAASWVPNKCHACDGQQEYAGYPNPVPSMLKTNLQALSNDVMLSAIIYIYI